MPSLTIVPASDVSLATFTTLLNQTYSDYYVPLDMSPAQMRERIVRDDVDMQASVVVQQGGHTVGLGMLAQRGAHGWIGGVGVLPGYRGQGIGRRIMEMLLNAARQRHIRRVQLEVIRQNTVALRLYDSLGFKRKRLLHMAEGMIQGESDSLHIEPVPPADLLRHYDRLHTVPNPWQREKTPLLRMLHRLTGYAALDADGALIAYAIGIFKPDVIRFVDLARAPKRDDALRALVNTLHSQHPPAVGSIMNIADDDPAWAVLFMMGYQPTLSQYEMMLTL